MSSDVMQSPGEAVSSGPAPESGAHVPRHLGLALTVIATAQLMIVLDATIVNVALPHIQQALGFSGTSLEWIVTAYALAFGSLLLLGGRLGDIFGRRRIFIIGVLVFSVGSLLGGFATSQWWLLTARALQGAGGALAAPTALALIATTFPMGPRAQPRAGRLRRHERRRRRRRPAARRHPHDLRVVALGVLRQRADRRAGHRAGADRACGRPARPSRAAASRHPRRRHQHGRPGAARLRPHPRRRRPGRRLALGRPGHDRLRSSRRRCCSSPSSSSSDAARTPSCRCSLLESRRRSGAYS